MPKKATFEGFKRAWVQYFGKPKKSKKGKRYEIFVNGEKGDFSKIYAYYYDYTKTPRGFGMKDYFYSQKGSKSYGK